MQLQSGSPLAVVSDSLTLLDHAESDPLLWQTCDGPAVESQDAATNRGLPAFPRRQMAALCSIRLVDPIAFTQIFPYVNEFMTDMHVTNDPSQVGFYSGVVESAFAVAQLCSIYYWAYLSDAIGRRPVVILGTLGIAVSSLLFGLCQSLTGVLAMRFLGGLFSGNVAVIHSVLAEITNSANEAIAYPIFGLFWPAGAIIGSLLGGGLSNPATKFSLFSECEFLLAYPYFLPCFVTAVIGLVSAALGYFLLEETLPNKTANMIEKYHPPSYGAVTGEETPSAKPLTIWQLLRIPAVLSLSVSGSALSFLYTAFDVVFVLFCYSPISAGGLAFSASRIGYALSICGALAVSMQVLGMPYLLRSFDKLKLYNFFMSLWPVSFATLPLLNLIARSGHDEESMIIEPQTTALLWISIILLLATTRIASLAYSVNMILVKDHAPNPASLGATNGLVQFCMCLARAISPAFVSSFFAHSKETTLFGGQLWVVVMVGISLFSCYLSQRFSFDPKL